VAAADSLTATLDLPATAAAAERFLAAVEIFPGLRKPTAVLANAHDELIRLLMPTELDYNCRRGSDHDITRSGLSVEAKAALKQLLFDYLSPWGMDRVMRRWEESVLRIRELVRELRSAANSKPWETGLWKQPTRQQRLILNYMWGRDSADGAGFVEHVFETHDAAGVDNNRIKTAVSRTCTYLAGNRYRRTLRWDRACQVIRWE
jgi:hypothetical protein